MPHSEADPPHESIRTALALGCALLTIASAFLIGALVFFWFKDVSLELKGFGVGW